MTSSPTILILAGQRLGVVDPLAAKYGLEHKCLVPLLGRPLITYVVDVVEAAFPGAPIIVSINDPRALDDVPALRPLIDAGRLTTIAAEKNLLESVIAAAAGVTYPLLVTTGDNVLMTVEALRRFHAFALTQRTCGAAMFARKEDILAAHSEGQPRFWKFRDGEFSGCNTFWLEDASALKVAEIFRGGGQFLKFPKRFISAFGLVNLIGFRLNLFTVNRMLSRLSARFGKKVVAEIVSDGTLAIDVDTEFSHLVAKRILKKRGFEGPDD